MIKWKSRDLDPEPVLWTTILYSLSAHSLDASWWFCLLLVLSFSHSISLRAHTTALHWRCFGFWVTGQVRRSELPVHVRACHWCHALGDWVMIPWQSLELHGICAFASCKSLLWFQNPKMPTLAWVMLNLICEIRLATPTSQSGCEAVCVHVFCILWNNNIKS